MDVIVHYWPAVWCNPLGMTTLPRRSRCRPGFGNTKVLGYHPILATRADTGEVVHARVRKGQPEALGVQRSRSDDRSVRMTRRYSQDAASSNAGSTARCSLGLPP